MTSPDDRRESVDPQNISGPEVTTMNTTPQPVGSTPRPAVAYRQLVMQGLAPGEAGNVTAVLAGIPIPPQPWTVREISHLLFLRALREGGRFGPDGGGG
jgi:hypothetical protein